MSMSAASTGTVSRDRLIEPSSSIWPTQRQSQAPSSKLKKRENPVFYRVLLRGGWVTTFRTLLSEPDTQLRQILEELVTFCDANR